MLLVGAVGLFPLTSPVRNVTRIDADELQLPAAGRGEPVFKSDRHHFDRVTAASGIGDL